MISTANIINKSSSSCLLVMSQSLVDYIRTNFQMQLGCQHKINPKQISLQDCRAVYFHSSSSASGRTGSIIRFLSQARRHLTFPVTLLSYQTMVNNIDVINNQISALLSSFKLNKRETKTCIQPHSQLWLARYYLHISGYHQVQCSVL